jgi:hypothetical protein
MRYVWLLVLVVALAGCQTTVRTLPGPPTTSTTVTETPVQVISTQQVTTTVTFTPVPAVAFGDGTRIVGTDIAPGMYKTSGDAGGCYYGLLRSTVNTDVIANDNSDGPMVMQVTAKDYAVQTSGGCNWSKVG